MDFYTNVDFAKCIYRESSEYLSVCGDDSFLVLFCMKTHKTLRTIDSNTTLGIV